MARERVVSRTIEDCVVECTVMVINGDTKGLETRTFHLGGQVPEEKALNIAKKDNDSDTLKIVTVDRFYKETTIYAMTEKDFLKHARPMDENRHFIDENGEDVSSEEDENDDNVEVSMNKDGSVKIERKKK